MKTSRGPGSSALGHGEMERVLDEALVVAGRLADDEVAHDDAVAGERSHHVPAVAGSQRRLGEAVAAGDRDRQDQDGAEDPGMAHAPRQRSRGRGAGTRPPASARMGARGPVRRIVATMRPCPSSDRSARSGSPWPARIRRRPARSSAVLCPPYDIISPAERRALLERDPHNAVRLELPADLGEANADDYRGAARTVAEWRTDGVLRKDREPAITLHRMSWTTPSGDPAQATGVLARLRLEPFGPGSGVLPHERTLGGPKEDRYALLRATGLNTSPIVLLGDGDTATSIGPDGSAAGTLDGAHRGADRRTARCDRDARRRPPRGLGRAHGRPRPRRGRRADRRIGGPDRGRPRRRVVAARGPGGRAADDRRRTSPLRDRAPLPRGAWAQPRLRERPRMGLRPGARLPAGRRAAGPADAPGPPRWAGRGRAHRGARRPRHGRARGRCRSRWSSGWRWPRRSRTAPAAAAGSGC